MYASILDDAYNTLRSKLYADRFAEYPSVGFTQAHVIGDFLESAPDTDARQHALAFT